MFEYYLPNKNKGATVVPKSKFRELNKGLLFGFGYELNCVLDCFPKEQGMAGIWPLC